jgi:hypothetical protein
MNAGVRTIVNMQYIYKNAFLDKKVAKFGSIALLVLLKVKELIRI